VEEGRRGWFYYIAFDRYARVRSGPPMLPEHWLRPASVVDQLADLVDGGRTKT
jgi:hypothetical protein